MANNKMTRKEVCEKLISNEIDTIQQLVVKEDYSYLESIIGDGVVGFNNLSNNDLIEEWYITFDEKIKIQD